MSISRLPLPGGSLSIELPPGYALQSGRSYTIQKGEAKLKCLEVIFTTPTGSKRGIGTCEVNEPLQGLLEHVCKNLLAHEMKPNDKKLRKLLI